MSGETKGQLAGPGLEARLARIEAAIAGMQQRGNAEGTSARAGRLLAHLEIAITAMRQAVTVMEEVGMSVRHDPPLDHAADRAAAHAAERAVNVVEKELARLRAEVDAVLEKRT